MTNDANDQIVENTITNPVEQREILEQKLDFLLSATEEHAKIGEENTVQKYFKEIKKIADTLDSDTSIINKYNGSVKAHLAHVLSDLAFNKVSNEKLDKVRYSKLSGNLHIDNEGILSLENEGTFYPIRATNLTSKKYAMKNISVPIEYKAESEPIKKIVRLKDNEILLEKLLEQEKNKPESERKDITGEEIISEYDTGKTLTQIYVDNTLVGTYNDSFQDLKDRITIEKDSPYRIEMINNSLTVLQDKKVMEYGSHNVWIDEMNNVYRKIPSFNMDNGKVIKYNGTTFIEHKNLEEECDDIYTGHNIGVIAFDFSKNNIAIPSEVINKNIHVANKGYDEEMINYAISLAKDSDMTREYMQKEFFPSIERRKTEAKSWHSILNLYQK
jgi:hypothetical protein